MISLLMKTLDKSMTRSNERESYYKKEAMEVLRNIISFFYFIFLLKKFILQKTRVFLFLFTFILTLL